MKLFNPFYIFSLIFIGVIVSYSLGWSAIYPEITLDLKIFLFISILLSGIIGFMIRKLTIEDMKIDNCFSFSKHKNICITLLFFSVLVLEGKYSGGFPLLRNGVVYKDFGIPTVHVIFFVFVYFYVTRSFEKYLETKETYYLVFSLLNLAPFILAVNRGILVLFFLQIIFLFLKIKKIKISFSYTILLSIIFLVFVSLFGFFGNARMNKNYNLDSHIADSSLILKVGHATTDFEESIVPNVFFWTYLYSSSPLANLQSNIDNYTIVDKQFNEVNFIVTQLLPDVLSKRIIKNTNKIKPIKIVPELTVATAFTDSFLLLGTIGMYIYIFFYFLYNILIIYLAKKVCPEYLNFIISVFCVIAVFQIFSNGLSYSVISLQVLLPFFFSLMKKIRFRN